VKERSGTDQRPTYAWSLPKIYEGKDAKPEDKVPEGTEAKPEDKAPSDS
jgi:hypothetical protein